MSETPGGQRPGSQADGADGVAVDVASMTRVAADLAAAADAAKRVAAAASAVEAAFGRNGLAGRVTLAVPKVLVPHFIAAPAPATVPPPQPPRRGRCVTGAEKAEAIEKARAWWLQREAELPAGATPPSQNDDERDAARDLPGVPRRVIRNLRPEAWRQKPSGPPAPKPGATA